LRFGIVAFDPAPIQLPLQLSNRVSKLGNLVIEHFVHVLLPSRPPNQSAVRSQQFQ
jgi:hypothetical protein